MYLRTAQFTANSQLAVLAADTGTPSRNNLSALESKKNGDVFKVHKPVDFMHKERNGKKAVRTILVSSATIIFLKTMLNMLVSFSIIK